MCLNWIIADLEGEQASFFGQKVGNYCHSACNGQTKFSMPKIARSWLLEKCHNLRVSLILQVQDFF